MLVLWSFTFELNLRLLWLNKKKKGWVIQSDIRWRLSSSFTLAADTCICVCWPSVSQQQRGRLSECPSVRGGSTEPRAADTSPRYSSHKSASRSPLAARALVPDVIRVKQWPLQTGQKSTEAFLYDWSWCRACSCDCGCWWRLGVCCMSAITKLGSGSGVCHITGQDVGWSAAAWRLSIIVLACQWCNCADINRNKCGYSISIKFINHCEQWGLHTFTFSSIPETG